MLYIKKLNGGNIGRCYGNELIAYITTDGLWVVSESYSIYNPPLKHDITRIYNTGAQNESLLVTHKDGERVYAETIIKPEAFDPQRATDPSYQYMILCDKSIITRYNNRLYFPQMVAIDISIPDFKLHVKVEGTIYTLPLNESVGLYPFNAIKPYLHNRMLAFNPNTSTFNPEHKECAHDWKDYTGLVEQFKYCTKCNERQGR